MNASPFGHQWGYASDVIDEDPTPEASACGFFEHLTPVEQAVYGIELVELPVDEIILFNVAA